MIRHFVALLAGVALGVAAALALLFFNPLAAKKTLSPLSVSDNRMISLAYSAVAADSLMYTNDGESRIHPYPEKVQQLWEAPIRRTDILVPLLSDSRSDEDGIGIKFVSDSEKTRLINGEALVDSVWHIILPDRGTLFVYQNENFWNYMREIVVPAYWSSAKKWKGTWHGNTTVGPGSLGTASVYGGSGEFAGLSSEATEALAARAYSVTDGPVSMEGRITIDVIGQAAEPTVDVKVD
jgi:hypothetical protein